MEDKDTGVGVSLSSTVSLQGLREPAFPVGNTKIFSVAQASQPRQEQGG